MTKVQLDLDEWYMYTPVVDRNISHTLTVDVDDAMAKRWKKTQRDFNKMLEEIAQAIDAQHPEARK